HGEGDAPLLREGHDFRIGLDKDGVAFAPRHRVVRRHQADKGCLEPQLRRFGEILLHPLDAPGADAFVLMEGFTDTGDVERTGEQARFVQRFLVSRVGTGQIDGVEADFLGKRDLLFNWEFGNVAWNAHSDVHGLSLLTWALARSPLPTLSIRYQFREDLRRFFQP